MSRSDRLKGKHGKSNGLSVDGCDEESAARTRPFSLEEIMLRRRNKELLENAKDPARESWNLSCGGSSENIDDHLDSAKLYKQDKSSSAGKERHILEESIEVKKVESTHIKEDTFTEGKDWGNCNLGNKLSAELNNKGRITEESRTGKEMHNLRKNDGRMSDYCKHSRDLVNKQRYADAETNKPRSEKKSKKKYQNEDGNPNGYHDERKHEKDRHDREKRKKWLSNDSEKVAERGHHIDSADMHRQAEGASKYESERKRKYQNGDDKTQDRYAVKKHNLGTYERKESWEKVKSHNEETSAKRRRSRSQECVDRRKRRSPSFSPKAQKHMYHDRERKELSILLLKDSSGKKHSDVDRSRASTNGSSLHHHRHGGSTSGLGGYSPRKRKSEAAVKTPSSSQSNLEKKRAGWDLPPVGTDNPSSASVFSSFQLSNQTTLSHTNDAAAATSVVPATVKPLSMSLLNSVSTGKNAYNIDSVQLTQATRPMRRLYLENLPASASEKALMDCFNNLLLSAGGNHVQQAQPCFSCILHKDKGQALVEFLTAEHASAALSFDGSAILGSTVKIRRPKDYVEVTTGEPQKSGDASVTISDIVIDSPDKIFIGGISNHLSSEMLMEIVSAFGSLKAYHFETKDTYGSCAFLEYVDDSVTVKACAGLNGMKLAGEVLTVVQAMPNASSVENGDKPSSYEIPEHAKPLLRESSQVMKIKDVFAVESLSSLSDIEIEEVLEDVRLECARFGTVRSLNVVKHSSDKSVATRLDGCEVLKDVNSKEALQDTRVIHNSESSFCEKATSPMYKGTSGVKFHYEKELEEDKVDNNSSVNDAEHADGKSNLEEQLVRDATAEDMGHKIPSVIIQECLDHHETSKDRLEFHDKRVANDIDVDIENKMAAGTGDSNNTVCKFQEGLSEFGVCPGTELVGPNKGTDKEDICDRAFEPGSVLVEYRRTEACCTAAHCLHGRLFDGRMVTVQYVPLSLYRERFGK